MVRQQVRLIVATLGLPDLIEAKQAEGKDHSEFVGEWFWETEGKLDCLSFKIFYY